MNVIPKLDQTDIDILDVLQQDARISYAELGRRVGLSSTAVTERVHRLEEAGVLKGYHADVDLKALGLSVTVFIELTTPTGMCFAAQGFALQQAGVIEAHCVTGEKDVIIKAVVPSVESIEGLVERLMRHGKVTTSIVLTSGKGSVELGQVD